MLLGHKAENFAEVGVHCACFNAVKFHRAGSWFQIVGDDIHKGGFACTVRSKQTVYSRREVVGEVFKCGEIAVLFGEVC